MNAIEWRRKSLQAPAVFALVAHALIGQRAEFEEINKERWRSVLPKTMPFLEIFVNYHMRLVQYGNQGTLWWFDCSSQETFTDMATEEIWSRARNKWCTTRSFEGRRRYKRWFQYNSVTYSTAKLLHHCDGHSSIFHVPRFTNVIQLPSLRVVSRVNTLLGKQKNVEPARSYFPLAVGFCRHAGATELHV